MELDPLLEGPGPLTLQSYASVARAPAPTLSLEEERHVIGVVEQAWDSAQRIVQPNAVDPTPDVAFERQMQSATRPPEDFLPGRLRAHKAAWHRYFTLANGPSPLSK